MIQRFLTWIRGVFTKMLHIDDAKRALNVDVAISKEMQEHIDLWAAMFLDDAPWLDDNTQSAGIAAAVASELARLTTVELESEIVGDTPRAEYLQEQYKPVIDGLRQKVEIAAAGGGMAFKPYLDGDRLAVDCVPAWRFLPTAYNQGEVTGAVFVEQVTKGKTFYTRMEHHQLTDTSYTIRNVAYMSTTEAELGRECSLDAVDEWADLEPELIITRRNGSPIEHPLFAYFRMSQANTADLSSPLGASAYSRAVPLIEEADKQWSRIIWEYEGSELAIDASQGVLSLEEPVTGGAKYKMPTRKKRLFRELGIDGGQSGDLYKVFSPAIRDQSLFNGFNQILRRIEFACGLAYGTLSDPQNVDKTAEEIRSSKQRSYAAVCEIQTALQTALEHLVWIMDFYADMYKLAPKGKYEPTFVWGDGILQDVDSEFTRRKMLVDSGYMRPEKLIAWYFHISEEEALAYLPKQETTGKLFPEEE